MHKRPVLIVTAIMLAGLALRYWLHAVTDTLTTDGVTYLATADFMRDSSGWIEIPARIRVPLFPAIIYLATLVIKADIDTVGRIVNVALGTAMIPLVYILARDMFDKKTGIIAAVFIAMDSVLIEYSVLCRADLMFTLLSLVLIYCFWKIDWKHCGLRHSILFGILIGITQLTRSNGVFYLLVFLVIWIFQAVRKDYNWTSALLKIIIPVLVISYLISSIPVMYLKSIDKPVPSYIGHAFIDGTLFATGERTQDWFKLNDDLTDFERYDYVEDFNILEQLKWDTIAAKYRYGWTVMIRDFGKSLIQYFSFMVALFFILGIFFLTKFKEVKGWEKTGYLLLFFLPYIFIMPAIQVQIPYLLPMRPLAIIIFAWAMVEFTGLKGIHKSAMVVIGILLLSAVIFNVRNITLLREKEISEVNGYRYVGMYLHEIRLPGDSVMAGTNTIYLFSKMKGYPLPSETLDMAITFCINKGIDYLVYGPVEVKDHELWGEELERLSMIPDSSLELIHTETRGGPIRVFRMKHINTDTPDGL